MDLIDQFTAYISKENLFLQKDVLLLAVSGGMDSVVLCELCEQAGYDFVIAHCNFRLRGTESDRDEQFVRSLGIKYNKPVLVKRFDTTLFAAQHKLSIQVAARELRYTWFMEVLRAESFGISPAPSIVMPAADAGSPVGDLLITINGLRRPACVLTAHHLDDNIETMLMNFFKGSGIAGLRGILPAQGKIIRPLLFAKKDALKTFAVGNNLAWVEDSSNASDKYSRNYFRNQLVPLVRNVFPEAEANLANNLQRFTEIEQLYHQSIELHKKKLLEYKGNEVHIPVLKLQKTVPLISVIYEIIKTYHFSTGQAAEAVALLKSDTGKYIQSATHRIIRNRNWLIISPNNTNDADNILVEGPGFVSFGAEGAGGRLEFVLQPALLNTEQSQVSGSANSVSLDAKDISFPLLLRKWKTGDYFYPLGMKRKKKLSRFLSIINSPKQTKKKSGYLNPVKKLFG